jgi:hypothetical protein
MRGYTNTQDARSTRAMPQAKPCKATQRQTLNVNASPTTPGHQPPIERGAETIDALHRDSDRNG